MKKVIPNFITSMNLVSGCVALIFAVNSKLFISGICIFLAMVFDFFDGFAARLLNVSSEIGKELDSLADLVSFGIAPAMIMYCYIGSSLGISLSFADNVETWKVCLLFSPVVMPLCAALRLAKFNIDDSQKTTFKGLPTPANAFMIISMVLSRHLTDLAFVDTVTDSLPLLLVILLVMSLLMVCRIPFLSFKIHNIRFKGNEGLYIFILSVIVFFCIFQWGALPLVIPLYVLSSFASVLINRGTRKS